MPSDLEAALIAADPELSGAATPGSDLPIVQTEDTPAVDDAPTEPVAPQSPAKDQPEPQPEPAEGPDQKPPTQDEAKRLLAYVKDTFGDDWTTKYGNDQQFLQGALNAMRLVGQREADAEYGRQARQALAGREQEVIDFLSGRYQPQQTQPAAGPQEPPTVEQIEAWQRQVAAGNAPPDVAARYHDATQRMQQAVLNLAFRPQTYWEPVVQQQAVIAQQAADQRVAAMTQQQQRTAAITQFEADNASWLYNDGKTAVSGFSPYGQTWVQHCQRAVHQLGIADPVGVIEYARDMVAAHLPQAKPTAQPKPQAVRQPAIAAPPPNTIDEDLDKLGLYGALLKRSAQVAQEQ